MKDSLISVIVPIYKVEKYLERCVQSIVTQSYENLEILLVDDGSPDNCGRLCDLWALRDSRIRVIHKKNGGLSDARNVGIQASTGEYVVFADSDDYLAPQMVERLYHTAVTNRTKLALCGINCITEDGIPTGESDRSPVTDEVLSAEKVLHRFYGECGWFYIVAWNRLYHRSLLTGETFPKGKWHEDEFVAAQIVWAAGSVASIAYPGYNYVTRRSGSIMQAKNDPRRLDAYEALLQRYRFYQSIGQTKLLHETHARVLNALERYCWGKVSSDHVYDVKMAYICREYGRLTGLPLKCRLKWMVFWINLRIKMLLNKK